jgi:hypothetical protein
MAPAGKFGEGARIISVIMRVIKDVITVDCR